MSSCSLANQRIFGDRKAAYWHGVYSREKSLHAVFIKKLESPDSGALRGTQRQFLENICSGDDLRSRIFGTFVLKFLASLPLLGFSNI